MIRLAALIAAGIASTILWYECGEDIGIFCYRIGSGAFSELRSRALIPVSVSQFSVSRNYSACSNRSSTFSTRSTLPRDFES